MDKPLYENSYMGFWIKVFPNRVEFKTGPGTESVAINQVASIQVGMMGYMQIIIETTGGKKYKIPCNKKKEVRDAIYQAQDSFGKGNVSNGSIGVADELAKLSKLKDQGIISDEEFSEQKKKLLASAA